MVIYGITLVTLAEELFAVAPDILELYYVDDTA